MGKWFRWVDLAFLLVIPALIYVGLMTEHSWDYGYTYPERSEPGNLLGPWGASALGWLRFHTGELIHYVPAAIVVVYLLVFKSPFSLFSRTVLMTALILAAYHLILEESLLTTEQMGNLPYWLRREFPSMLPFFVPVSVLALLIGCGKLILRLVDPPEREPQQQES